MKTRTRYAACAMAVIAVIFCSTTAFAYFPDDGGNMEDRGGKNGDREGGFLKELGLSDQQRQQVEENRAKTREAMKSLRETLKAGKAELKAELDKPTVDMGRVNAITEDIKSATSKLIDHRVSSILALKSILTPEQFSKMTARMEEKTSGRWKKHANGMNRRR